MNKEKNEKKDRGNHVSIKGMIIAMIAALLAFLGIGNFDLGNGDGVDVGTNDGRESSSTAEDITTSESTESQDSQSLESLYIIVRQEQIFVKEDGVEKEMSLEELTQALTKLESGSPVTVEDDGSVNRVYEQVIEVIDGLDLRR